MILVLIKQQWKKNKNIKFGYSIFDIANWFLLYKEKMIYEKL